MSELVTFLDHTVQIILFSLESLLQMAVVST